MAFEPIFDTLVSDYKKKITAAQVVAECKLTVEGAVKISKVLSIHTFACATGAEMMSGEARLSGSVLFKVLFNDAEGVLRHLEQSVTFNEVAQNALFTPTLKAFCTARVLDTDTVSVSATEIRLASVIELDVEAIVSEKITYLSSTGEDVYTQEEEVKTTKLVGEATDEWTHEVEIDPKLNIVGIFAMDSFAILNRIVANDGVARFEGRVFSTISFETEGGMLKSMHSAEDFEQEIALTLGADGFVDGFVALKNVAYEIVHDEKNDRNLIKLTYSLRGAAYAFSFNSASAIIDAFSVKNELNITSESIPLSRYEFTRNYNDRVEGTATLESDMPEIDSILSVCAGRLNVTAAYCSEGKVTLDGVINTAVIYYNASSNTKNSISVELPFSLSFKEERALSAMTLIASGALGASSARIKRGNEVELTIDVYFNAVFNENKDIFVINELELGEERKVNKSAIAIYITRGGETLWDVAKALMSTPELIMQQNPSLKLPVKANERVLVYRQI